jgi:hypothetical protein
VRQTSLYKSQHIDTIDLMEQPEPKVLSYIQAVLESLPIGGSADFRPFEKLREVPVWINHAARFTEVRLSSGYKFILAEPRTEMAADRLLALYRVTQAALQIPLILVVDQQPHQVRSALMRARIGLVRSGRFLFAPQFGVHVKDTSKPASSGAQEPALDAGQPLLPQEQVFLAAAILHESLRTAPSLTRFVGEFTRLHSQSAALHLEPEKMLGRLSRAIARFQHRNLVTVTRAGKEMNISFASPEVLWAHLCRDSQSLVARMAPVFSDAKSLEGFPVSGLSALCHYSDLLPPVIPTLAMSRAEWTSGSWQAQGGAEARASRHNEGAPTAYIEIWKTNPRYLGYFSPKGGTVNPVLLALNLRRDPDERVRIAIREMLEGIHISAEPLWAF